MKSVREFVLDVMDDEQIESRIKSFLSLEDDRGMARTIFSLEQKYAEKSEPIFTKYAEIVDATENIRDYLYQKFDRKSRFVNDDLVEKIMDGMLKKGKRLLTEFSKKDNQDEVELVSELESYKAEIMLFASTFKAVRESGEAVKLEELPGFGIETVDSGDLSETQRHDMIEIFSENWQMFPEVKVNLLESFQHALESPGKKFYLLKYEKEIIGFIRFDQIGQDELLAASFNVDKNANGSGIGEAILKNYLTKEAESNVITAYAYPRSPIVHRYVGEFGFVITGVIPDYKGTGEPFFKIERDDRTEEGFQYFNAPSEDVIRASINENNLENCISKTFDTKSKEGMEELTSLCDQYFNQGYVITAYREVSKGSGQFCAIFEKPANSSVSEENEKRAA